MNDTRDRREIAIAAYKQESGKSLQGSGRKAVFRDASRFLEQDWAQIVELKVEVEKLRSLLYEWIDQQYSENTLIKDTETMLDKPQEED